MAYDMDDQAECPLCMEQFEMDDLSFFPCTCGYQICRFCWHRIRTDENGLCPACRKPYSENPADFKPLTNEELQKIKAEKKQKDLQKKLKMSESKKHLANVRVVQKNLVFVVGLSPRLSDPEVLKRHEYFGKFGKIHKVVINHSTQYVGGQQCRHVTAPQGPSASAYVTYYRSDDALRAIGAVNNVTIENRTLKASLGTTKYCSHFMKNQPCPKTDCMYLHEPGDEAASFTKEAMQQGKHTEFEKKLHDQLYQQSQNQINRVKDRRANPSQSESGSVAIPSGSRRPGSGDNSPPDGSLPGSATANGSWPLLQPTAKKSRGRKSRKRNAESAAARTAGAAPASAPSGGGGGGGGGGAVTLLNNQSDDENSTGSRERQTDSSRSTPLSQSAPAAELAAQPAATPPPPAPTPPAAAATPPVIEPEPSVARPASPPPPAAPSPAVSPVPVAPVAPVAVPVAAPVAVTPVPATAAAATMPAAAPSPVPTAAIATLTPPPGLSHPTPASSAGSAEWLVPGRGDSLAAALLNQPTPPPEADDFPLDDAADDLDFDPFEETEKGLSALLEREREQLQARQAAMQRQQAMRLGGGLPPAPGLTSFNAAAPRARLPPPGFSGPSGLGLGSLGHHPHHQQHNSDLSGSKMLPFLNGMNGGGLNGLNGLNGLSRPPPPGRPRAMSPPDNLFSDLSNMMMGGGQGQPPPPPHVHSHQPPRHDSLKDWQGLKKHFPNINISFSSGGVAPPAAGGLGRFPPGAGHPGSAARHPAHHGHAPPLARFMAQPPKPPSSHGWSSGAGSDWTAMDPAIVSSGQLAGPPRCDSPPHWLRSLEQLTETGPMYPPAGPPQRAPALWTSTPPPGFNPTL